MNDNETDNVHPVRNFIDKKTKNTFQPWFHDKNDDPNNTSEAKKSNNKDNKNNWVLCFSSIYN